MTKATTESAQELHRRAEEKSRLDEAPSLHTPTPEETEHLLHDLRVHQIELEMQAEELRDKQQELDAERARYFDLYELAPFGYLTFNEHGLIQEANLSATTMLGVTRTVLLHNLLSKFIFPEDQDNYFLLHKRAVNNGDSQTSEMRLVRGGGDLFWAELQITPARNGEYRVAFSDITGRKQVDRLKLSILDSISDAFFSLDDDMVVTYFNNSAERILGKQREEVIGKRLFDVFPEARGSIFEENYSRALKEKIEMSFEAHFTVSPYENWYIVRVYPYESGISVYFQTITELKLAEEEKAVLQQQLQHAQKLESLGVLAGGIAHDFNNILAIIIGYCYMVKMDYKTAEEHIPLIEKAAERAAGLCRQMLAYAGKSTLTQTRVNMSILVNEMVNMLEATIPQNTVIKTELSANIPFIAGDASQIRQIAMNLIINASEAIGEAQGVINVSLKEIEIKAEQSYKDHLGQIIPVGCYVCLEVTDDGGGMSEETRQRIFEPFYTTKFTGRGLGMSAVLGIIKAHKGALQLFSQPGHGTTFKVYLPAQSSVTEAGESLRQLASVAWKGRGTILLVEDEEEIRLIAKTILTKLGFTIIEASNGKEALELYQVNSADITLVVTDIGMSVMDGYELFRELKKIKPELPIIVSSGFGNTEVTARISRDDIAGLVSKPYNFEQMREVLKRVVDSLSISMQAG